MGHAKQVKDCRAEARKVSTLPEEIWWVQGVSVHGDEVNFNEVTFEAADRAAEKINKRGGKVAVTRCVYNGPAANWLPVRDVVR